MTEAAKENKDGKFTTEDYALLQSKFLAVHDAYMQLVQYVRDVQVKKTGNKPLALGAIAAQLVVDDLDMTVRVLKAEGANWSTLMDLEHQEFLDKDQDVLIAAGVLGAAEY